MTPVIAPAALPSASTLAPPAVVQKAKPAPHGWTSYTVRSGDTLAAIADHHGTTTGVLLSRNRLSGGGSHLSIGQHLSVPKTAAQARSEAARARAAAKARAAAIARSTYVVRSGDTLGGIAARKGVSLAALLKANHLSSRSMLQVGQKVRIPGTGAASTRRPSSRSHTSDDALHGPQRRHPGRHRQPDAHPARQALRHEPPERPQRHPPGTEAQGPRHHRRRQRHHLGLHRPQRRHPERHRRTPRRLAGGPAQGEPARQRQPPERRAEAARPRPEGLLGQQRQHVRRAHLPELDRRRGPAQPQHPRRTPRSRAAARRGA